LSTGIVRADIPKRTLDYSNLLDACRGNEGQPRADQHCDTYKGDADLGRNPADPLLTIEELIGFLPDGKISSSDPIFDRELNDVLNLNAPILVNNRAAALRAFKKLLRKRGNLPTAVLRKLLAEWSGKSLSGDLQPFCEVIVYWLRKRLARP
jgi:hypothetical protein